MTRNTLTDGAMLITVLCIVLTATSVHGQTYRIINLGDLGGPVSAGYALNNLGRSVGVSVDERGMLQGLYWDGSTTRIPSQITDGQNVCLDVNETGQIAAQSFNFGDITVNGVLWHDGAATNLGQIAPRGINDVGQVVGYISIQGTLHSWVDHAATWSGGIITDLGTLGGNFSYASAIDNNGRIVGWSFTSGDQVTRATQWNQGVPSDLGSLSVGGANSQAFDVSDTGYVVGCSESAAGQTHAFLFTIAPGGSVTSRTDLGTLAGGYSYAYGVNNLGQVVGTSDGEAFLWDSGIVSLKSLLPPDTDWKLDVARAINDRGDIVGMGRRHQFPRAFLMTTRVQGDSDDDLDIDLFDYAAYLDCLSGPHTPTPPGCETFDFDEDQDVDYTDIALFQVVFTGGS